MNAYTCRAITVSPTQSVVKVIGFISMLAESLFLRHAMLESSSEIAELNGQLLLPREGRFRNFLLCESLRM